MSLELQEIEKSDLEIDNFQEETEDYQEQETDLQRTEIWREERRGNWTGSQFKNCMTCNAKGGKLDWVNNDKVYYFSEGAIKYIFANAMERKTGRYIQTDSTKEMKYGTIIEPLIFRRAAEELAKNGLVLKKVGFKSFDDFPTAGVSSDAIVLDELKQEIIGSGEFKACASWSTLYERTFELLDEKSIDFWQTQGQMLAWNVSKNWYVVASPPKDINVYLRAENIIDYYEEWCTETEITIQVVDKSPIHLNALKQRIQIMESTVNRYLEEDGNLKEILYEEIDYFKKNQKIEFIAAPVVPIHKISFDANPIIETTEQLKEIETAFENVNVQEFHVEQKIEKPVEVDFNNIPF